MYQAHLMDWNQPGRRNVQDDMNNIVENTSKKESKILANLGDLIPTLLTFQICHVFFYLLVEVSIKCHVFKYARLNKTDYLKFAFMYFFLFHPELVLCSYGVLM